MTIVEDIEEVAVILNISPTDKCRGCGFAYASREHHERCDENWETLRRMRGWSRKSKWA